MRFAVIFSSLGILSLAACSGTSDPASPAPAEQSAPTTYTRTVVRLDADGMHQVSSQPIAELRAQPPLHYRRA